MKEYMQGPGTGKTSLTVDHVAAKNEMGELSQNTKWYLRELLLETAHSVFALVEQTKEVKLRREIDKVKSAFLSDILRSGL